MPAKKSQPTLADSISAFVAELEKMQAEGLAYAEAWEVELDTETSEIGQLVAISEIKLRLIRSLATLKENAFEVRYGQTYQQLFTRLYGGVPSIGGFDLASILLESKVVE